MRADRLISLVLLLRNRGRMSAAQLAAELEVSERTVLRDIEALSTSGFPVFAERGRHGGFELLPGFTTDLTGLTAEEATALLAADASTSLGMSSAFTSAMRKVAAALPDEHRRTATTVADRVLVRPDGWLRNRTEDAHLASVQHAVFESRKLRIEYEGRSARVRTRVIDPIGLVCAAGISYLLAGDRGEDRTYRVSRIIAAEVLDEPAVRNPTVDLAALWDARRSSFLSTRTLIEARIRVRENRLEHVASTAIRMSEPEPVEGGFVEGGFVEVEVVLGGEAHAGSLVWMLEGECEILGPPTLRAAVHRRAERMMRAHEA